MTIFALVFRLITYAVNCNSPVGGGYELKEHTPSARDVIWRAEFLSRMVSQIKILKTTLTYESYQS